METRLDSIFIEESNATYEHFIRCDINENGDITVTPVGGNNTATGEAVPPLSSKRLVQACNNADLEGKYFYFLDGEQIRRVTKSYFKPPKKQ